MKKRQDLPNFIKLPYEFDIERIKEEIVHLTNETDDDLHHKNSYGALVGGKTNKLQKTFGLKFNTIEEAYEYLQQNDVNESELRKGLPENRRMTWDFRNYVKPFENYIKEDEDETDRYVITGSPYKQLAITEFNPDAVDNEYEVSIPKSRLDERHYNKLKDWVPGTYLEEVINTFKGDVHRVRVAIMDPGAFVGEHMDYNTDYSVRFHIPLITNDECGFYVKRKGEEEEYLHMPAEGGCWFLNQGWPHSAWNKGITIRSHIILSVYGQEDIQDL